MALTRGKAEFSLATLIAVYNSEGCVGRCDARCYEAHESDCDCICGGLNHGAGYSQASDNTTALAGGWLEKCAEDRGLDRSEIREEVFGQDIKQIRQPTLW